MTISTNANYFVGSPNNATVTIADNDGQQINPNGYWEFENNTNDTAGMNNGTFNGGTAVYATGKVDQAIDLDGTDDYVDIPYSTDPTAYTVTAWVEPTDVTSVNIVYRGTANPSQFSHQLRITSGSKFEHYTWDGQSRTVTGTTTVQANTWYHVAMVASNGGTVRLYVNGVEEGTPVGTINSLWTDGDRFYVGNTSPVGGFFDGLIDDVRIYEQVLSAADIQTIYSGAIVTVAATNASASESSDPGTFTFTRTGSTGSSLVVNYTVNGTATSGTDYSCACRLGDHCQRIVDSHSDRHSDRRQHGGKRRDGHFDHQHQPQLYRRARPIMPP